MSDHSAFTSIGSAERSSNEMEAFPPAPVAGPPDQRPLKGTKNTGHEASTPIDVM